MRSSNITDYSIMMPSTTLDLEERHFERRQRDPTCAGENFLQLRRVRLQQAQSVALTLARDRVLSSIALEQGLADVIAAYNAQGNHRTGTPVVAAGAHNPWSRRRRRAAWRQYSLYQA